MHVKLQVRSNRGPPRGGPSQGGAVQRTDHTGPESVRWQAWESFRSLETSLLFAKEAVAMAGESPARGWKTGIENTPSDHNKHALTVSQSSLYVLR